VATSTNGLLATSEIVASAAQYAQPAAARAACSGVARRR
jgi:hypothetical protein